LLGVKTSSETAPSGAPDASWRGAKPRGILVTSSAESTGAGEPTRGRLPAHRTVRRQDHLRPYRGPESWPAKALVAQDHLGHGQHVIQPWRALSNHIGPGTTTQISRPGPWQSDRGGRAAGGRGQHQPVGGEPSGLGRRLHRRGGDVVQVVPSPHRVGQPGVRCYNVGSRADFLIQGDRPMVHGPGRHLTRVSRTTPPW